MRKEKVLLKEEIKSLITKYDSLLFIKYLNLNANAANQLRTGLAELGGELEMVPKRLLKKAAEDVGLEIDGSQLNGHIGLLFCPGDPLTTAKYAYQFKKENADCIDVIAGRIDGNMYNASEVEQLSKLPSLDEMRANLLSLFVAPMSQTVSVMNALLTSVMHCLQNKSEQQS